jgi:hypothetical protein
VVLGHLPIVALGILNACREHAGCKKLVQLGYLTGAGLELSLQDLYHMSQALNLSGRRSSDGRLRLAERMFVRDLHQPRRALVAWGLPGRSELARGNPSTDGIDAHAVVFCSLPDPDSSHSSPPTIACYPVAKPESNGCCEKPGKCNLLPENSPKPTSEKQDKQTHGVIVSPAFQSFLPSFSHYARSPRCIGQSLRERGTERL